MSDRMYLVPEDIINSWRSDMRAAQVDRPVYTAAVNADKKIVENLKNNYSEAEKAAMHGQHLRTYLNVHDNLKTNKPVLNPPLIKANVSLDSIPKHYRRQAQALLQQWETDPEITWNKKLEVNVKGNPNPGSNVIDLLTHAVSRSKKAQRTQPPGFKTMQKHFKDNNLPLTLVNNDLWLKEQSYRDITSSRLSSPENEPAEDTVVSTQLADRVISVMQVDFKGCCIIGSTPHAVRC